MTMYVHRVNKDFFLCFLYAILLFVYILNKKKDTLDINYTASNADIITYYIIHLYTSCLNRVR